MNSPDDPETTSIELSGDLEYPYRMLSRAAVVSVVLGLLSLAGYLFPGLLVMAAVGLVAGFVALNKIRTYPQEFSGSAMALMGLFLNAAVLLSGLGLHAYIYATEVPEGYQRISFSDLQPEKAGPIPYPPERAFALNGKDVFISGYMFPDEKKNKISQFVLIPDLGTCCFGGQPKLTDMVQVTLKAPIQLEFRMSKRKLAGKFQVDPQLKPVNGVGGVYYQLDASFAK